MPDLKKEGLGNRNSSGPGKGKQTVWKKFRHEIDQSDKQNPHKKRKYKDKWKQDVDIMNWALDRKF